MVQKQGQHEQEDREIADDVVEKYKTEENVTWLIYKGTVGGISDNIEGCNCLIT